MLHFKFEAVSHIKGAQHRFYLEAKHQQPGKRGDADACRRESLMTRILSSCRVSTKSHKASMALFMTLANSTSAVTTTIKTESGARNHCGS